ncbi:glycosyltransferase family 2 protein [Humisphaera borealis]|uniref:Glycosyltransferase family 2 protein n=1 Tax=Humisphaera borealis TaxID=2807512 RepID=A0A7M2X553_9BACT|nr:glycosyltransferase family 2 protein [Humisphaera borealis]
MRLSVVIPVFNEAGTIHELVGRVVAARVPAGLVKEIVCVNDASTDGTAARLDALPAMFPEVPIRVIHLPVNRGKGAAVRAGFAAATGDVVLIQDADLEYDPDDYPTLLEPIVEDRADVVYGSRFIGSEPHRVHYFWHSVANRMLTLMSNMMTNLNLTDMEVGYKVFRASVLKRIPPLKCDRFGFEPEVTAKVARLRPRVRVYEVGVSYHGRSYEEGKKITWIDGIKAVLTILRFRIFK